MKKLMLGALVALSLAAIGCGNPCEKLAKAVCDKVKDAKICEAQKARAKSLGEPDKDKCKSQLQSLDKFVEGLQKFQQMKEMFKDFSDAPKKAGVLALPPPGAPVEDDCVELARAVCAKAADPKICDPFTETTKGMDKNLCKAQRPVVEKIVVGLQAAAKAKELSKSLVGDLAKDAGPAPAK